MKLGRLLRTVRHIRPGQAAAQALHLLRGAPRPVPWRGAPPALRVGAAHTAFLPAPRHARWDGARRIELIHRAVTFRDAIDWDFADEGPLWAYHLHQFDYARQPALAPGARTALLLDWIERHPSGVGWNPHPISLRILSWGKLLLAGGALALSPPARDRILASLASQAETLARHPERRLCANHLFSNWLGVAFAGLLLDAPGSARWLAAERPLRRELAAQVGRDGLHEERSPMYHALLLENVLDLLNLARAVAGRPGAPAATGRLADALEEASARMLGALAVLTHPDGEIALFADSAFGIAHPPAALLDYARRLGVTPRAAHRDGWLDAGGYVRLEDGPFVLLASVAGPAPAHQPGHAHCDALAFELSVAGERLVTDSGVPEYIPGPLREACRSVRAHATLEIDGREPAEIWGAHRVGGRPRVEVVRAAPPREVEALCAGWSTRDTVHRRRFVVEADGVALHDAIEGRPRPVVARLPFAPDVALRLAGASRGEARLPSGRRIAVALPDGLRWRIESMPCFPEFGLRIERPVLVGEADRWPGGVWRFALDGG